MYNPQSHDTTAIAFEITLLLLAENEVAQVSYFGQDNFSAYRKANWVFWKTIAIINLI